MMLESSRWTRHNPRWPYTSGHPRPLRRPWAAPLLALCMPQTPTARAIILRSALDPYDAMRGTADRLRPTTNSASDPVDMSQPLPMAPTGLPQLQTWPMSSYPFNKIFPTI
ncbi:hypothetical protein MUG91_G534n1, partial [Manis pentadactyla]